MSKILGFDIYGTLINTHGLLAELEQLVGDRAVGFSQAWRDKQLEYSFRRGLMGDYASFAVCTRDALAFTCAQQGVALSEAEQALLLEKYRQLPAFDDVSNGLARLRTAGHALFAFSNGTRAAVDALLQTARIADAFVDVVSVDEVASFKPDPAVYRHFAGRARGCLERVASARQPVSATGSLTALESASEIWLISSNPFDVIGAIQAGLKAAWVQRSPDLPFDVWSGPGADLGADLDADLDAARVMPDLTVTGLEALADVFSAAR